MPLVWQHSLLMIKIARHSHLCNLFPVQAQLSITHNVSVHHIPVASPEEAAANTASSKLA
jgi:hypothetical protein